MSYTLKQITEMKRLALSRAGEPLSRAGGAPDSGSGGTVHNRTGERKPVASSRTAKPSQLTPLPVPFGARPVSSPSPKGKIEPWAILARLQAILTEHDNRIQELEEQVGKLARSREDERVKLSIRGHQ